MKVSHKILVGCLAVLIGLALVATSFTYSANPPQNTFEALPVNPDVLSSELDTVTPEANAVAKLPALPSLETQAESAILMDAASGQILYEKNAHKRLAPASMTKIMTLLLAIEALEQGKMQLTDQVVASENAWDLGGSEIWLEPGERMSVQDLLLSISVGSANDACVAIAEHLTGSEQAFVEMMNQKAQELGMNDTHYTNSHGLPAKDHYTSAYDMAILARYALRYPEMLELTSVKHYDIRGGKNKLDNTNKLLYWYDGTDGLKTGFTEEAKYCLTATAKRGDLRLISVVMSCPEPRSHFTETTKLFNFGFANFVSVPVVEKGKIVQTVKVEKGMEDTVNLVVKDNIFLTLRKGEDKTLDQQLVVNPSIIAPIKQGDKLGEIIILRDGNEVARQDLIADRNIQKAGIFRIFHNLLKEMTTFHN